MFANVNTNICFCRSSFNLDKFLTASLSLVFLFVGSVNEMQFDFSKGNSSGMDIVPISMIVNHCSYRPNYKKINNVYVLTSALTIISYFILLYTFLLISFLTNSFDALHIDVIRTKLPASLFDMLHNCSNNLVRYRIRC